MNILHLLDELEKLLTELLLWLVFIPRTLFRILSRPSWVPTYINEQLEKKEGKFRDYMSPIILFIFNSLILFFLFEFVVGYSRGFYLPGLLGKLLNLSSVGDVQSKLSDVNTLIMALGFMLLPILFAVFIELFKKKGFTRSNLQRALYIQAYYFSPVFFMYFVIIIFYNLLPFDRLFEYASNILFTIMLFWFSVIQIKLLRDELSLRKLKATLAYLLMVIMLFVVSTGYDAIAKIKSNSSNFGSFDDVILPRSGTYYLSIRTRSFLTLDYDVHIKSSNAEDQRNLIKYLQLPPNSGYGEKYPFEYKKGDTLMIEVFSNSIYFNFFDLNIEYENDLSSTSEDGILDKLYTEENPGPEINSNFKLDKWESRRFEDKEVLVWKTTVFAIWGIFYTMIWGLLFIILVIAMFKGMFSKITKKTFETNNTSLDKIL